MLDRSGLSSWIPRAGPATVLAALLWALTGGPTAAGAMAEHPRLIRVILPPDASPTALFESGLDLISVSGPREATLLEWPHEAAIVAALGARVELLDADPGRTAAARSRADRA